MILARDPHIVVPVRRGRKRTYAGVAAVVMGVIALAVSVAQAAPQADARLTLDAAGGTPVVGQEFVVAAAVESLPVPNGPPFDFTLALTLPGEIAFVSARGLPVNPQCTTAGQVVTCRSRSIGGEITTNINYTLRAARAGSFTIRGSVTLDGATDTGPANNSAELTVNVDAAPVAPRCVVPRVVRKTLAAARQAIARAGCRTGTIRRARSATVGKGRVIRQAPAPGKRVARGTRVALVVSKGP